MHLGINETVSTVTSLGVCGFLAGKVCDKFFSKIDTTNGQKTSSHPYVTTALKIAAFIGDIALCVFFAPIALYVEGIFAVGRLLYIACDKAYDKFSKSAKKEAAALTRLEEPSLVVAKQPPQQEIAEQPAVDNISAMGVDRVEEEQKRQSDFQQLREHARVEKPFNRVEANEFIQTQMRCIKAKGVNKLKLEEKHCDNLSELSRFLLAVGGDNDSFFDLQAFIKSMDAMEESENQLIMEEANAAGAEGQPSDFDRSDFDALRRHARKENPFDIRAALVFMNTQMQNIDHKGLAATPAERAHKESLTAIAAFLKGEFNSQAFIQLIDELEEGEKEKQQAFAGAAGAV